MKKRLIGCLVFFFLTVTFFLGGESSEAFSSPRAKKRIKSEPLAQDFTLETLGAKTITLSELRGKGVILFFFTTWCPHCRHKIPELTKQYERYKRQNIELLVIDVGESVRKVRSFVSTKNYPFDILLDVDMKTAQAYNVIGVPAFILVSREGQVVYEGNVLPGNYAELLR